MNTDLGKVYIVGDDGTYQPLDHITDAELTPTDECVALDFSADVDEPSKWQDTSGQWHIGRIPTGGELTFKVLFHNNQRKQAGLI